MKRNKKNTETGICDKVIKNTLINIIFDVFRTVVTEDFRSYERSACHYCNSLCGTKVYLGSVSSYN